MRERGGRTLAQVFPTEAAAVATIRQQLARGTVVRADESSAWNSLHASFVMQRINHQHGYSVVCVVSGRASSDIRSPAIRGIGFGMGQHQFVRFAKAVGDFAAVEACRELP